MIKIILVGISDTPLQKFHSDVNLWKMNKITEWPSNSVNFIHPVLFVLFRLLPVFAAKHIFHCFP